VKSITKNGNHLSVLVSIIKKHSLLSKISQEIPLSLPNLWTESTNLNIHMNRLVKQMSNPNQLYDDMERLNALYEELCWGHDDELVFTHENGRIIIKNKTQELEQ